MNIYVDIDETICETPVSRNYNESTPIKANIKKINTFYETGHIIIYWTARGTTTGLDWYGLTKNQLDDWGCKYHKLKMGKPAYDLLICDKTKRIEEL